LRGDFFERRAWGGFRSCGHTKEVKKSEEKVKESEERMALRIKGIQQQKQK